MNRILKTGNVRMTEKKTDRTASWHDGKNTPPAEENRSRSFTFRWKLRLILLFIAAILFVWLFFFRDPPGKKAAGTPRTAAVPAARGSFYVDAEFRAAPAAGRRKHQAYAIPAASTVSGHPYELLSPPSFCVLDTGRPCRFLPPVFLFDQGCQLWASSSFSASALRGFMNEMLHRFEPETCKFSDASGVLTLDLKADARLTVLFVKQLQAWGLRLVGPASAPRPDEDFFRGEGTERVRRRFIFLTIPEDSGILPAI